MPEIGTFVILVI